MNFRYGDIIPLPLGPQQPASVFESSPHMAFFPSLSRSRSGSRSRSKSLKRPGRNDNPTRVWVGGLPERVKEQDLDDTFGKYGELTSVNIRSSRRDVFAFIEFKEEDAALKAINELDQSFVRGNRVKCHWAQFKNRRSQNRSRERSRDRYSRRSRSRSRSRRRRRDRRSRSRSSRRGRGVPVGKYKVEVENIPRDMTWMDLKSLMRDYAGRGAHSSVTFARTWSDRDTHMGMVEFSGKTAMNNVIEQLHKRRINGNKVYVRQLNRG